MKIRVGVLILVLFLAGCVGKTGNFLMFSGAYDAAVKAFKQGKMMQARELLISVKKEDKMYRKSQSFLRKKVNPARLKLLRYYAKKGKKEEKLRRWAQAEEAYKTAASLSIQPKALLRYQGKMQLKVRQLRSETLYAQRKVEDQLWLQWLDDYNPPKGVLGDDAVFQTARVDLESLLDVRIKKTWRLAEQYRKDDIPELAWVYADSYLRFKPQTKQARDLKNAMATAIPKGFRFENKSEKVKKKKISYKAKKNKNISVKHIHSLIQQKKWLKAKGEALVLRRQGDTKADKLLGEIQSNLERLAAAAYTDGNLAFRLERIDQAVKFWSKAASYMPNEQSYADSLRKGKQIQERLNALKLEESSAEKKIRIEE